MAKSVAVIGAGPAGLTASKTLLYHAAPGTTFAVTLFDAQPRIGGLWPCAPDDAGGLLDPFMLTNQSKHSVQFSDLAWEPEAPEFPYAWQTGRYLKRYLERYCMPLTGDGGRFSLRLGEEVVQAEPVDRGGWNVVTRSLDGKRATSRFDYIVVASGYFGKPLIPSGIPESPEVPVIHSSRYRDLRSLLGDSAGKGGKILIVGGQMSGVEIAGTVGSHLSSAINSPGTSCIPNAAKYSLHHLIQRPVWVKPLFVSPEPAGLSPTFLPMDVASYNMAKRPGPLKDTQGHITVEAARIGHSLHHGQHGSDQSEFHPLLAVNGDELDEPPYLAISENYMELIRSGLITLSKGKLKDMSGNTVTLSPDDEKVADIAAVILATGFGVSNSLSFLPPAVLDTLQLYPKDLNNTVALAFHNTYHPDIPNVGFCGFYRSPFWGVIEMQARFLAAKWSAEPGPLPAAMQKALDEDGSINRTLSLRDNPRASQFPMGDYLYLMQEFSKALEIELSPPFDGDTPIPVLGDGKAVDVFTPSRYVSSYATREQMAEIAESLRQTRDASVGGVTRGKWVARAVFRSLLGEWKLERDLRSRLPSHPSGHFSGTAKFLLRDGTVDGREGAKADGGDVDLGQEYLYIEEGNFKADNGMSFRATRRYIWRYDGRQDRLSVWFVKTDDQMRADYLFHEVGFKVPDGGEKADGKRGWQATAGHLCVEDFYDIIYEFKFNAVNLTEWTIGYSVKGPKKDYTIQGTYRR